jgi:hypothetical protein
MSELQKQIAESRRLIAEIERHSRVLWKVRDQAKIAELLTDVEADLQDCVSKLSSTQGWANALAKATTGKQQQRRASRSDYAAKQAERLASQHIPF